MFYICYRYISLIRLFTVSAMGDQLVIEASAIESVDFHSHFFDKLPTDLRFEKIVMESFKPVGNFNNDSLSFNLPKLQANQMYRLHEALLHVNVRLADKDSVTPPHGSQVSVVNNVLYSLFNEVEITLNSRKVSKDDGAGYSFMCYLHNLLNYGLDPKMTQLAACGWYTDTADNFTSFTSNMGLIERQTRFAKWVDKAKKMEYHDDAVPFMGKFLTDLTKDECDILSGIEVDIRMHYSTDAFRIIAAGDSLKKEWRLTLKDALLHVPIATINHDLYTKIEKRYRIA